MKRVVLIGIILMLLTSGTVYAVVSETVRSLPATVTIVSILAGDANGDDVVNAVDITAVERVIAGLDLAKPGADANGDGDINTIDITKVERLIAGLD